MLIGTRCSTAASRLTFAYLTFQQWEDEIRRFVKPKWKIHLYHGKGKISLAQMRQCDVILTSFGHVAGALPSEKPDPNNDSEEDMQAKGDLLKMKWYRVCVDEASYIRNSKTKAAKAIYELRSTYRWILSGQSNCSRCVQMQDSLSTIF